jgi:glyoxylase I family protein
MLTGFHHVTLRVTDLSRARAFYEGVLGLKVDQDFPGEKLRLRIGETDRLVLHPPLPDTPSGDRFSEQRIGLDHLAIGVSGYQELERLAEVLRHNGVAADLITTRWARRLSPSATPTTSSGELFEQT